ncbi:MAG: VCBS repeat-containing protein, partial [Sphingobacteriales bacterium]|nr:VCBS repeat-containing protein [Sphingobacteriales bacterium]
MEQTGIVFNNKVTDDSLENSFYFRNYYNGGGVGLGDINNDGLADVILTSNMGGNKLYLNKGGMKFEDITSKSGMKQDSMWSTGVVLADINNDGWLDIYISNSGHMVNGNRRNKLYINNHDLTFSEEAAKFGLDIAAYTTQVSFFDYDLDGDLDCFMINNSPMPINNLGYENKRDLPEAEWPVSAFLKGGGDHLYRNDNHHYTEVTRQAGIHGSLISFGLGVTVGDVNDDGYPDVYVANDSYERDYLYINQQNGTFKDELETCVEQNSFSSMGADIADINNDGYPDIFTTDMLPGDDYRLKTLGAFDNIDLYNTRMKVGLYRQFMKNCLMVNNKNGAFIEAANFSGVQATDWSWGALFFDADNDGYNDIYVCNGINHDVTNLDFMEFFANDIVKNMVISGKKQSIDSVLKHIPVTPVPNKAFKNNGNLRFSDAGEDWGFMEPTFSNGAAYGDMDNDGDLDLVLNNENQESFVYRNNSREQGGNNYVGVILKGRKG